MKFKILFISLFLFLNSKAQSNKLYYTDNEFRETRADSLNVKLDSIFLVGIGSSFERIFLNDLSDKLIQDFSSIKIFASYAYLGKNSKEAKKNYNDMKKEGYKAVLFFCPSDTSTFNMDAPGNNYMVPTPIGIVNVNSGKTKANYQQTFDLQFFKIGDKNLTKIWSASVDIDCDPSKKKGSKKLGKKIISRFKANNYIE